MQVEQNIETHTCLLERIEHNTACQRNNQVTIHDFIHLNPPVFHSSTEPLDADDWFHDITHKLHSANVAAGDHVPLRHTILRVWLCLGRKTLKLCSLQAE